MFAHKYLEVREFFLSEILLSIINPNALTLNNRRRKTIISNDNSKFYLCFFLNFYNIVTSEINGSRVL